MDKEFSMVWLAIVSGVIGFFLAMLLWFWETLRGGTAKQGRVTGKEMIDFRRPFWVVEEEVVAGLPPAGQVRIEALLWVLIRLVYELGRRS